MRISSLLVCVSCFVGACAGGSRPAATAPAQASPSGSAASGTEAPAQAESAKPTMESQRERFIQGCVAKAHLPDYCECGFEQFRQVFKDADLTQNIEPGDARLKLLQEKTVTQCASKMNEEQVKANFLESCEGGDPRKAKYCTCAWPALRKQLTLADFIDDTDSPRFVQAKQAIVTNCKGKFPVEIVKHDFMTGCTKDHPEREKACTCIWKKVIAKYSAEEIAVGAADVKSTPGIDECKK